MSDIVELNSKRAPVVYTVTIVHHYDDTLEFRIEGVADDERSRDAVMSAFRRISGANEDVAKLRVALEPFANIAKYAEKHRSKRKQWPVDLSDLRAASIAIGDVNE